MIYNKPKNLKYTDMCIYIDTHIYDKYDENLVYQYLYLIIHMLARKMKYFEHSSEYDEFSLYLASRVYLRLINKSNPPIKSVLNYIKRIIGVQKITWQKEVAIPYQKEGTQIYYFNNHSIADNLVDLSSLHDRQAYDEIINSLDNLIYNYLIKIPFKKYSAEWYNIYISVLLTLLNSITLTQNQKVTIAESKGLSKDHIVNRIYMELRNSDPILYHLDNSFKPYIKVLSIQIRHLIANELSQENQYYISPENIMKNLLVSEYTESNPNEY